MKFANIISYMADAFWKIGGIGAAADLCMEDFGSQWAAPATGARASRKNEPARPAGVRGTRRTVHACASRTANAPLEAELCWNCCSKPLSR